MNIYKIKKLLSEINEILDFDKQKTEDYIAFDHWNKQSDTCALEVTTMRNAPFIFNFGGIKTELTKAQAEQLSDWIIRTNEFHYRKIK